MQPPENQPPPPYPPPYPQQPPEYQQPAAPPEYQPAPYGAPPAPPRRGRGGLFAILAIVLVVLLVAGGYLVGGFVVAQGELNSANDSYNTVVGHQNKLGEQFSTLTSQINAIDFNNASADNVKQAKTAYLQLVTQAQSSEPQVVSDDASLASADSKLKQNSWLTVISSGSLQTESKRIGYARAALAIAKTILDDSQQFGTFNATLMDAVNDLLTFTDAASKQDISTATAAVKSFQSDVAKGITEDKAPGLASSTDQFMHDLQTLANDFDKLLTAAVAGDQAGINSASAALDADNTKLDTYDFNAMDTESKAFFQKLNDQYQKQVDLANKT
jgi:hypothetical protein